MTEPKTRIYRIETRVPLAGFQFAEAKECTFEEACTIASKYLEQAGVYQTRFSPMGQPIAYGTYLPQFVD